MLNVNLQKIGNRCRGHTTAYLRTPMVAPVMPASAPRECGPYFEQIV